MTAPACSVAAGQLILDCHGERVALDGALLRAACRCAQCRALAIAGTNVSAPHSVTVLAASPLGYGVQLHFSDGHNRGIFPWSYLNDLAGASSIGPKPATAC